MPLRRKHLLVRYMFALVCVWVVIVIKLFLPHAGRETPSLMFFGAIMASAWYGGFGPGAFATIVAAWATNYFFLEPFYIFDLAKADQGWRL